MPGAGRLAVGVLAAVLVLCGPAAAQVSARASVADLRAELVLLDDQIRQVRDALVAQGTPRGLPREAATPLTRVDQLEAELRRITARVEVLSNELSRVVEAATNRVGEIEFRLTELEGGDVSLLATPEPPLGGGITTVAPPMPAPRGTAPAGATAIEGVAPSVEPDGSAPLARGDGTAPLAGGDGTPPLAGADGTAPLADTDGTAPPADGNAAQLTVTEQGDFDRAVAAAEAGDHAAAAAQFDTFLRTYPGGPLSGEAQFRRGEALAALGDWQGAARSFLDAFSGAPEGPRAPRSLFFLAVSLGEIGKKDEACLTLDEVDGRYPGSEVAAEVALQRETLRCG